MHFLIHIAFTYLFVRVPDSISSHKAGLEPFNPTRGDIIFGEKNMGSSTSKWPSNNLSIGKQRNLSMDKIIGIYTDYPYHAKTTL